MESEINVANLDSHSVSFYRDKNQIKQEIHYYFSTGIPENIYDGDGNLNTDLWNEFYDSLDIKNKDKGALPFRVWEITFNFSNCSALNSAQMNWY